MKVLVTGGAGFIGSHLVGRLVAEDVAVRVLDNFSTGSRENLKTVAPFIELVEGDICSYPELQEAMRGVDVVFHQAALCSVPRSLQDPQKTNKVNVEGTLNVLVAARHEGVRRLVYASSSSVYGDTPSLPKRENQPPQPASPYAVTKLTGELYCQIFWRLFGLDTFALRYFNVFGPRQDPDSPYAAVIPRFVSALAHGEPPVIYGDGLQSRDFSYVDNVVEANILAMKATSGFGEAFNVACGQSTTVAQLAGHLRCLLAVDIMPVHAGPRAGDVRNSLADIGKAESVLGYSPRTRLLAGLQQTVEWYQNNGKRHHEPARESASSSRG